MVPRGEEAIEGGRVGLRRQRLVKLGGDLHDPAPAFGRAEDPAHRRKPAAGQVACRHAVGRDHELLDQLLGAVLRIRPQVGQHVAVEDGPRLERLEAQRATRVALALESLGHAVLEP